MSDETSNAVELIVSIIALTQKKVDIVQESLLGSMLSNLLLVLGFCFFLGGLNRVEQHFNVTVAQTASSLLALAIGSLIIPAAFEAWAANNGAGNGGIRLPNYDGLLTVPPRCCARGQRHQNFAGNGGDASASLRCLSDLSAQDPLDHVQCTESQGD